MTSISDALVLPKDLLLVPVGELPSDVRERLSCDEGDYALTRPRARAASTILERATAELVREFTTPRRIVEAVASYSRAHGTDPHETLEEAYPLIQRLVHSNLLVPADSASAEAIEASFAEGDSIDGFEVARCVQVLEDSELYRVSSGSGEAGALKILRPGSGQGIELALLREAEILARLDGEANPPLLGRGVADGRTYLVTEWCDGVDAATAAHRLRNGGDLRGLLRLCVAVLRAYARLHAQGVTHADVHYGNVLVGPDERVKVIDYGLAQMHGLPREVGRANRGGVAHFLEPEFARARLGHELPPRATERGEQYSLAALVYLLLTGRHYVDFSPEKEELRRQIAEEEPLAFAGVGFVPWPEVERALRRALAKDPGERFDSVSELADTLAAAPEPAAAPRPSEHGPLAEVLRTVLERVALDGPLLANGLVVAPFASVNYGAAGIADALTRIATAREDPALLALADVWAVRALTEAGREHGFENPELPITVDVVGRISPYHAPAGIHCVRALLADAVGDMLTQQEAIEEFAATSSLPCENLDLTLGRSGTLLACALLLDRVSGNPFLDASVLVQFGEAVEEEIATRLAALPPVFEGGEIEYLGAAHGWAGMLYALLAWSRAAGRAPRPFVRGRLDELASAAVPNGSVLRWPRLVPTPSRPSDYVAAWCNGTAGFVHLFVLASDALGDAGYLELARAAALDASENPESYGDLCCGLAGRAYALLAFARATEDEEWSSRAAALAARAAEGIRGHPLYDSLYKGAVGVAVLAAELAKPETAAMPLFDGAPWRQA